MSPVKADVFISSGTKEIKLIDISSLENVSYKLKCFSIQQHSHNTDDFLVNVCFQLQVSSLACVPYKSHHSKVCH